MTLVIPTKRGRVVSPLPVRERIKVRVLVQRAILFARDLRFCFRRPSRAFSPTDDLQSRILNRAPKKARCKRTLTSILSLSGRGEEGSGILRFALNDTKTNAPEISGTKIRLDHASSVSCVIPSGAEGPRIFLDAGRCTPNHGATTANAVVPD